ncbi:hypothetical protein [Actinocorallia libanotica]|uniref:Alpha amylase inhibitor n=1 Tax=Actinocorallia libanotica TaxID=46162 RepID=A0ABN1RCZ6_9ACTN
MRTRVKIRTAVLAAAFAAPVAVIGTAVPAHAEPTGCTITYKNLSTDRPKMLVTAQCAGGSGYYRIVAKCTSVLPPFATHTLQGAWATAGPTPSSSYVTCIGYLRSPTIETA